MEEPLQCLAWSPAEELLAVGAGQNILAFRATQTGFEGSPHQVTRHAPQVHALAFSGDGTLLASVDAQGLKIWDVQSARLIVALEQDMDTRLTSGVAFHPTSPLLAAVTAKGSAFRILDLSALV
jgi:WD40 repeat protein